MLKILHALTQFRLGIGFLWASIAHIFLLAKMASEEQKPLVKMDFLLVCG